MAEARTPSWYLKQAKNIEISSLSTAGRLLFKELGEFGSDIQRKTALRTALVLNTPWVSLLNFPNYPYSDLPAYQTNESASEIFRAILQRKIELQAEMPGFDEANRILEEGFSAMYRELVINPSDQSGSANRDQFLFQMAFIRREFMEKTEEGGLA